jgi:RHS repeat-associated protein
VDQDFITEQAYDANGNLVMSQDLRGMRTFTVYDALNRPLKTVANAKAAATVLLKPGDSGYVAVNDPRSDGYARSTAPDRDQVTETKYDALGRVIRTRRLLENRESEQWDVTLYGYDALGRQVRVIQHTSQPAYNLGADPSLFVYPTVSNADQDHVTNTEYDAAGRVLHTIDVNGTKTRSVYDGLGRVVKTIANYVAQGSSDPAQWVWSSANNRWEDGAGNAIHHGTNFDQNIITETDYDADGRVDLNRTFQGLVSKSGYNARGRTVINVQNFVDNSYDPVNGWVWNGTQWVDHGTQSTPIARGVGYDQNIISGTEYDAQSRVLQTRDVRGHVTRFVYDTVGRRIRTITHYVPQGSSDPAMWVFEGGVWKQGAGGSVVSHGADNTQNLVSDTVYDVAGRVVNTRDTVGRVSRTVYDRAGRTTLRVQHYTATSDPVTWVWVETPTTKRWEDGNGNALTFGSQFDQNHVSQTEYNQSGQVSATRDTRGTRTTFGYDDAGRRVTITAAQGSGLDSTSYTCYDKAGRVLRTIQRYIPQAEITPDERANGQWVFKPLEHGSYNDENLSTEFTYDAASRRIAVISPTGNVSQTGYAKDGQVVSQTDPLGVVTHYSYDQLRRRVRVVQNYVAQGSSDPAQWVFAGVWKQSPTGANIAHGANSDQNIIVTLKHDAAGQMREMHDPRGNVTTYAYDRLGRRISATNPLSQAWLTAFTEVNQTTQTTQTYPNGYSVQRNFDPLGRLARIQYHDLPTTPDVQFAYDLVGQRTQMTEFGGANFTSPVRATTYGYDAAQRLTSVGYDTDGGGTVDETVSYTYDVGGLRMQLTLPGNLSITYQYDRQGRLIAATDWDSQRHAFSYDGVDRHVSTRRPNRLTSQYRYDVGGRLRQLRHHQHGKLLGQYDYTVDARGNRTQARELVRQPGSGTTTTTHTPNFDTTDRWGKLDVEIVGYEATITYGTHADGSYFDVYVNGSLWESFDGYSAADGEKSVVLRLTEEGRHTLSFRNRYDHAPSSTGYRMHIKTVVVTAHQYSNNVINYSYDQLARLIQAALVGGATYIYGYDLAGNLTNYNGTSRTFDAANRLSSATYDANGNMTSDGTNAYVWDRANRLLTVGNTEYRYNGDGNRISQTIGGIVTKYLLDTQPGLALVLAETTGSATTRYMHGLRGIHATEASTSVWTYPLQDGLGSVRNVVDTAGEVQQAVNYTPYGVPDSSMTGFAFTGEQRDPNGLQYHRARYYAPELGLWASLDPFEGIFDRPMSLNGYSWVEGNVPNFGDPTGAMPKKDEIESGRMRYSCNCGWLDAFHIMGGFTKSKFIREALSTSINWNNYDPSVEHGRFIYLHRSGGINVKVFQSPAEYTAYVPEEQATSHLEEVALGIYKGFENHFETLQSQANAFDGFMGDRASGFSIEDFPSDLVGYYIGKNDKSQSYHLDTSNQFEALWQTVESRTPCSIMNSEDSLYMLDQWRP